MLKCVSIVLLPFLYMLRYVEQLPLSLLCLNNANIMVGLIFLSSSQSFKFTGPVSCFSNDWLPCLVEKSEMWNFYVSYFIKCLNVKLLSKLKPLATKFVNWHFEISVVKVCTSIFEGGRILFFKIEWIKHVHLASLAMSSIEAPTFNYLCQLPCSVAFCSENCVHEHLWWRSRIRLIS